MPPTRYYDPTHEYPQHPPTKHTRTLWVAGNVTHIRLSPPALTYVLEEAHRLGYIRKPTYQGNDSHRYLSIFLNYAIAAQPGTYPFIDTRPPHIRAQDPYYIQANRPLPWSYELPKEEKQDITLQVNPLTAAYFHLVTQHHQIPILGPRYAQQPIPRRPVAGTIAAVLEAIGLQWLTPSYPYPPAPESLYPAPFRQRTHILKRVTHYTELEF
jgi:hypothetical protein